MKNWIIVLLLSLLFCCCQKETRSDKLVTILQTATEQIKEAKNLDRIKNIETETQESILKVMEEFGNDDLTDEESQKLTKALNDYYTTYYQKSLEFGLENTPIHSSTDSQSMMMEPLR